MKYVLSLILFISLVSCVKEMKRTNPLDGKTLPLVVTNTATNLLSTSATAGGYVKNDGGLSIIKYGMVWSKAPNASPDISSKVEVNSSANYFSFKISPLTPYTTYYVRAFATNLVGTAYGSEYTFRTNADSASLTTLAPGSVTSNSFVTGGNISSENGSPVTLRGLVYSTLSFPTITSGVGVNVYKDSLKGPGIFTRTLSSLSPGITYFVRAYAQNSFGTSYGNQVTVTTNATFPILSTYSVSAITSYTGSSGATVVSDGGAAINAKGVVWSKTPLPTVELSAKTMDGIGIASFKSTLTPLVPGTLYYVRAYATNIVGTAYGAQESFTTSPLGPTVVTGSTKTVKSTEVDIDANIVNDGGSAVTDYGFVYSLYSFSTISTGTKVNVGNSTGGFSNNIGYSTVVKNLTPGTKYYIRAYATNKVNTAYGDDVVFNTFISVPMLTTSSPALSIGENSAIVNAIISNTGGSAIISKGIVWSKSSGPTISDFKAYDYSTSTSITASLNNLEPGTKYYAKAFAQNLAGINYSDNEILFTTTDNSPKLASMTVGSVTVNAATFSAKTTSQGISAITSKGFILSKTLPLTYFSGSTSYYFGAGLGDLAKVVTGLSPGTNYYACAYATNNNITYGYSNIIQFKTLVDSPRVMTDYPLSSSAIEILLYANATSDGGGTISKKGFVWSTTAGAKVGVTNTSDNGVGVGAFSFTLNFATLLKNTTYYYRAYATNEIGTTYGTDKTFTTLK